MLLHSGGAYAERPAPAAPALPHDALCHIFSFLPRGELAVTPGRVCRAWAAAKAQVWAALPALSPGYDDERCSPCLPLWYTRGVFDSAPRRHKDQLVNGSARHGQVEALEHFYMADRSVFEYGNASYFAAKGGQLGVLHWLRQRGCRLHLDVCNAAACAGHLPVVQYCREQGCPCNAWTCSGAAEGGHLRVLAWLHENGCPWRIDTCRAAARGGHLSVLQYCRRNGCPWDELTSWWAAHRGHLSVLQWCVAQGCPINVQACIARSRDPACRAWLKTLLPAAQQE